MQFCFIANGDVLTLPITPASYEWTTGKNIETINVSQLGDVYLPGNRSRHSGTIECLLPSQDYPFNQPGNSPGRQRSRRGCAFLWLNQVADSV